MALTPRMGDLERAVMEVLWDDPERAFTVREVHETLAPSRSVAYTTVMTVLDRLAKKSVVSQEREGRAYRYRAAGSRGAMTAALMAQTLSEFADEDRRTALLAFVGEASADDVRALREALGRLERDAPGA